MQRCHQILKQQEQTAKAHIVAANEALVRINAEVRKSNMAMDREIKRLNQIHSLIR